VQKAAVLEQAIPDTARADRLRNLVLARIACARRGATRSEVVTDLARIAGPGIPPGQWRKHVERAIARLAAARLIAARAQRLEASGDGVAQAAAFLGLKGELPRSWDEVREVRLVAVALGMQHETGRRMEPLATPEGLRGAIVETAHKLKIKGIATPARLREALAATALERAFGNKSSTGLAGKLGLSPRAGRLLAAQLSRKPREFGTDSRLVAALAAEHVGAAATDAQTLRASLLRRYFAPATAPPAPARRPAPRPRRAGSEPPAANARPLPLPLAPAPAPMPPVAGRPDLSGFALEVRRHAASQAQGWSGDRKAYISHVWRNIRDKRPDWGLSEIEFKCMLAEAHRSGQLALANADLKDANSIKDVQESAVVYRNAVFHFIRVDR
jgi:hypothetical protein